MAGGFAGGLIEGIPVGIKLGEAYVSGRNNVGVRKANDIISKIEALRPPGMEAGGIPDGEGIGEVPTGYDGLEYGNLKTEYSKALRSITDPEVLKAMTRRLVEVEREKILGHGKAAIAASLNGDLDGMQRNLAAVSYYTDPGTTPDIRVMPDGNTLIQDPETGHMQVMTPENIGDYVRMLTDFEGWQDLTFQRSQHRDMMDHRAALLAQQKLRDAAYIANQQSQTRAREETQPLELERIRANIEATRLQAERLDEVHVADMDKRAREVWNERVTEGEKLLEDLIADPETLNRQGVAQPEAESDVFPGDEPVMPAQSDAQRASQLITEASQIDQAQLADEKTQLRSLLMQGQNALEFGVLLRGLLDADEDMSGTEAANWAIMAVTEHNMPGMDPNHGGTPVLYDYDTGRLKIGVGDDANVLQVSERYRAPYERLLGGNPNQTPQQAVPTGP